MNKRSAILIAVPVIVGLLIVWGQQVPGSVTDPVGMPSAANRSEAQEVSGKTSQSAKKLPPVEVTEALPIRQDVPVVAVGLGAVQASLTIGIRSQVDGKIDAVPFTEGQHVKKGDVLVRIDPRLYQAALDAAKAKRAQDAAMLVSAKKDLERYLTLGAKSFQSQQSIDQQQAKVDQLEASIAADDAAIETAQTQLDYTEIRAPQDGRVGVRLVDPGNLVRATDSNNITTLMQTKPSAVMFTLPAQQLDDVRKALAAGPVEVTAYDQDNREKLATGRLLLIDNSIDQTTATIKLKALFPNEDERLWPGQFVNARLLINTVRNALTVPRPAIQRGPNGLFVWVADAHNLAAARPVQLGPTTDTLAVVAAGISDADRVIVGGQYKLQIGSPIITAPPPPLANGG